MEAPIIEPEAEGDLIDSLERQISDRTDALNNAKYELGERRRKLAPLSALMLNMFDRLAREPAGSGYDEALADIRRKLTSFLGHRDLFRRSRDLTHAMLGRMVKDAAYLAIHFANPGLLPERSIHLLAAVGYFMVVRVYLDRIGDAFAEVKTLQDELKELEKENRNKGGEHDD